MKNVKIDKLVEIEQLVEKVETSEERKKRKYAEACKRWYDKKGQAHIQKRYLKNSTVIQKKVDKVKDNELFIIKLVETVGLVKIVSLVTKPVE